MKNLKRLSVALNVCPLSFLKKHRNKALYPLILAAFIIGLNSFDPKWYQHCWLCVYYLIFTVRFMKLENLLQDMRQPCVLDIKMGRKTYDPFASKEKIAMETAKFPPAKNLGYQISGMLVRYGLLVHVRWTSSHVIIISSFFTKV